VTRLALALVLLAGCTDADEALRALDRVKGVACKCEGDPTCKQLATTQLDAWNHDYGKVDGSAAQAAKAQADLKAIAACLKP
jgi:hypothetical protein